MLIAARTARSITPRIIAVTVHPPRSFRSY
jgi:hypothetical protein